MSELIEVGILSENELIERPSRRKRVRLGSESGIGLEKKLLEWSRVSK